MLMLLSARVLAQDTTAIATADSGRKDFLKIFHWTEKHPGEFEITVLGYDSLKIGNNEFQNFFYTTSDKPDGKLTVKDDKGNKVREIGRAHV